MNDYKILTGFEEKAYDIIVKRYPTARGKEYIFRTTQIRVAPEYPTSRYFKVRYVDVEQDSDYIDTMVHEKGHSAIFMEFVQLIKNNEYEVLEDDNLLLKLRMIGKIATLEVPLHRTPVFDDTPNTPPRLSEPTNRYKIFLYYDDIESFAERNATVKFHLDNYIIPNIV